MRTDKIKFAIEVSEEDELAVVMVVRGTDFEDLKAVANGKEWVVLDDGVQATGAWSADYDDWKRMYAAAARVLNNIATRIRKEIE